MLTPFLAQILYAKLVLARRRERRICLQDTDDAAEVILERNEAHRRLALVQGLHRLRHREGARHFVSILHLTRIEINAERRELTAFCIRHGSKMLQDEDEMSLQALHMLVRPVVLTCETCKLKSNA
eukprot:4760436-Pleurochrysis_carterae.AAC.1